LYSIAEITGFYIVYKNGERITAFNDKPQAERFVTALKNDDLPTENIWSVNPSGIGWSVKKGSFDTIASPLFGDPKSAIEYAVMCAKSDRPSLVHVYHSNGETEQTFYFED